MNFHLIKTYLLGQSKWIVWPILAFFQFEAAAIIEFVVTNPRTLKGRAIIGAPIIEAICMVIGAGLALHCARVISNLRKTLGDLPAAGITICVFFAFIFITQSTNTRESNPLFPYFTFTTFVFAALMSAVWLLVKRDFPFFGEITQDSLTLGTKLSTSEPLGDVMTEKEDNKEDSGAHSASAATSKHASQENPFLALISDPLVAARAAQSTQLVKIQLSHEAAIDLVAMNLEQWTKAFGVGSNPLLPETVLGKCTAEGIGALNGLQVRNYLLLVAPITQAERVRLI